MRKLQNLKRKCRNYKKGNETKNYREIVAETIERMWWKLSRKNIRYRENVTKIIEKIYQKLRNCIRNYKKNMQPELQRKHSLDLTSAQRVLEVTLQSMYGGDGGTLSGQCVRDVIPTWLSQLCVVHDLSAGEGSNRRSVPGRQQSKCSSLSLFVP